jgi:hypothetical protein
VLGGPTDKERQVFWGRVFGGRPEGMVLELLDGSVFGCVPGKRYLLK